MKKAIALGVLLVIASCAAPSRAPSSFNVFFNANSAVLTAEATTTIEQAASAIRQVHPATVAIAAGAGVVSSLRLAQPRYTAVRQALEAKGISSALIAQASLPASGADLNEAGNQRVEIILGH